MSLIHHHSQSSPADQYPSTLAYGIPPQMNIPRNEGLTHNGWNQQVPTHMPWGVRMSNSQQIVKFEGEPSAPGSFNPQLPSPTNWWQLTPQIDYTDTTAFSGVAGSHKRKLNTFTDGPSRKQLITDEKMAAELDRLHITTPTGKQNAVDVTLQSENDRVSGRLPTLVLSEELKKLQKEPLIPSSLLQSLERPAMAVVLWKPPGGGLRELVQNAAEVTTDERDSEEEKEPHEAQERMEEDPDAVDMENNNNVAYVDQELDL